MKREPTHGVFEWHSDSRYKRSEMVRAFTSEKLAQNWADKMNRTRGRNYVVRTLSYLLANPVKRTELLKRAARLYNDFTGHGEFEVKRIRVPNFPRELVVIGEVTHLGYDTVRDGVYEKYMHPFRKRSRPLFCVSPDGLQIFLIDGKYQFTDRGIVDK